MKRFPDLNAIVPLITLILPEAKFRLNLGKAKIEPLKQAADLGNWDRAALEYSPVAKR